MDDLADVFLVQKNEKDALWELFHANTKLTTTNMPRALQGNDAVAALNEAIRTTHIEEMEAAIGSGGKRYATTEKLSLPRDLPEALEMPLKRAIALRTSRRTFAPGPVELTSLAALCRVGAGQKPIHELSCGAVGLSRCIPSAGALYPLELYLLAMSPLQAIELPTAEVWHYEPQAHCLERIYRCDPERVRSCFQSWPERPPSIIALITAVPKRQSWKYGARAYRYALMEAGHAVQNITLAAAALELNACPVVGFYDDALHDLLDIDGVSEVALYSVYLGGQ